MLAQPPQQVDGRSARRRDDDQAGGQPLTGQGAATDRRFARRHLDEQTELE